MTQQPAGELSKMARNSDVFMSTTYFETAEPYIDDAWRNMIFPLIEGVDFGLVVDLAAGYGRNSAKLIQHAGKLIIVDINADCITACKKRFSDHANVEYLVNDGFSLNGLEDDSATLIYSFDAMVHFETDVVLNYIREFARVLRPGGHVFCHHSNYSLQPGRDFKDNPHWRNFMSRELFSHYAIKSGLQVKTARTIGWGWGPHFQPEIDCLSLLYKPMNG